MAKKTAKKSKASQASDTSLVIVESPAKAKTINRYLGGAYRVMASVGHIRDLPDHDLGIDLENGFEPVYVIPPEKKKTVRELQKAAKGASRVFLATDLDREGEAIAWHLAHALGLDPATTQRVVFNEITKAAIQRAFSEPHRLDMDKVNAQQARRLLDRIVGYQLSPLLQQKIGRGLSAGRVQSVAVRLVVEREQEIRAFIPEESWRVMGVFATEPSLADKLSEEWAAFLKKVKDPESGPTVKERNRWLSKHAGVYAELIKLGGKTFKPGKFDDAKDTIESLGFAIESVEEHDHKQFAAKGIKVVELKGALDRASAPPFRIAEIQKKRTKTRPNAPFTTATLQQTASSSLGLAPSRTMRLAQDLYEGVDLGGSDGQTALITYMRTDSTNLSKDSVASARDLIADLYSADHLPDKPNVYGSTKRAQEAHEAIRPTDVTRTPESVKHALKGPQYKLYDLIWRRFVACQMSPAEWDNTTVHIAAETPKGEAIFKAGGRRLVFDGYLAALGRSDTGDVELPELSEGNEVAPIDIEPTQQFTSPPPRYSEAALVKKMEAEGIGRPSTYAAIIQTIQDRGYVELMEKKLFPTARGELVTEQLIEHFPKIMDPKFTSYMEEELDKIEEAHLDWVHVLGEFYGPFRSSLEAAEGAMDTAKPKPSPYDCSVCGKQMLYRIGRNGRFLACSGYPECTHSMNVDHDGKPVAETIGEDPCPKCGKKMILRRSRLGPFLGCSGYPECDQTLPSDEEGNPLKSVKPEDIKEKCGECGGEMTVKFSRGRSFLGCSNYPSCKATQPIPAGLHVVKPPPEKAGARCDKCGRDMVIRTSRRGPFLSCSGFPKCRNAMPKEKLEELKQMEADGKIPDPPPPSVNGAGKKGGKRAPAKKVDIEALGPPPKGFEWTRTGRPVVENWPEDDILTCPECKGTCAVKTGRFGPYFGCTNYPKCSFVANLRGPAKKHAEAEIPGAAPKKPIPTDVPCDECGKPMVIRTGRSGKFLGCSGYPKCRGTKEIPEGVSADSLAVSTK